ncbi:MAG TPA: hypothetical protein VGA98_11030 [Allosphingosinicella sp.]
MPTTAQDRIRGGPFGALLILLSLFLGSATATAAASDFQGPATRLGSSRPNVAPALLPPAARNALDDEAPGSGIGPSLPPAAFGVVTGRLWTRPGAETASVTRSAIPRPASASYRARAPPAL